LLDNYGPDSFAWLDGDTGFVTAGVAARVAVDAAASLLETMHVVRSGDLPQNAGPRLVGALPFDTETDGPPELILPARIVTRDDDGRVWSTTIEGFEPAPRSPRATEPTSEFVICAPSARADWYRMVRRALDAVESDEVEKVVLARRVDVDADRPFDVAGILRQLRATQPGSVVYAHDGFVGASAELLVRRTGARVVARPMAGTGDDPAALLASAKDAHEHRVVVDALLGALRSLCRDLDADGPVAVRLPHVTHLATTITGTLCDTAVTTLDLVQRLHPTPAVGGWPAAPAQQLIRTLEPEGRGRYAGPCGWIDARGDGEFVVALRCAEVVGRHARCYAGAGIVAGSEPEAEFSETQAKLQPMLRVLIRP